MILENLFCPGADTAVMIKCALILWAIEHLYVIKFDLSRHILLELALVAAVRALDQAVPCSLPVSLALKRFQLGLRGLEVTALLRRITTTLGRALPQPIRESTSTYKDV
jgi:hypothetical protein